MHRHAVYCPVVDKYLCIGMVDRPGGKDVQRTNVIVSIILSWL